QSLSVLRRDVGDGSRNGQSDESIAFEPGTVWCDVVAFEQACKAAHGTDARQLSRGGFLDGWFVSGGSTDLEAWITSERTRLGQLAVHAAADVVQDAEQEGDLPTAVQAARQAIALDPDDEKGLARLIALLDRSGDRAGAVRAFETFRRRLEKEYDATPSPETAERIQTIKARRTPFAAVETTPPSTTRRRPRSFRRAEGHGDKSESVGEGVPAIRVGRARGRGSGGGCGLGAAATSPHRLD